MPGGEEGGKGEGLLAYSFRGVRWGWGVGVGAYWPNFEYFNALLKTFAVNKHMYDQKIS